MHHGLFYDGQLLYLTTGVCVHMSHRFKAMQCLTYSRNWHCHCHCQRHRCYNSGLSCTVARQSSFSKSQNAFILTQRQRGVLWMLLLLLLPLPPLTCPLPAPPAGDYCSPSNSSVLTCPALSKVLVRDGAQPVSKAEAMTGQPKQGHYVALLAKPYRCSRWATGDYHFLRKNSDNTWSSKLPTRPPSNRDVFGKVITDPESQPVPGYYLVCGYFRVAADKVRELP